MATNIIEYKNALSAEEKAFVNDIRSIVSTARTYTYKTANQMIVISNWLVGRRIVIQEQNGAERAEYGKHVIEIASEALTKTFGKGYGVTTLRNYRKFYLTFRDITIQQPLLAVFKKALPAIQQAVVAESKSTPSEQDIELPTQLSWMHYERLMRVDNAEARMWYMKAAAKNGWSYRTLDRNISTQYYHRLMQTPSELQAAVEDEMKQKTLIYQQDKLDFMKNPVVAEFLGLPQNTAYSESKLGNHPN